MKYCHFKRIPFLFLLFIILLSCSSTVRLQENIEQIQIKPIEESFSTDGIDINITDTVNLKSDINGKLELARQHYLSALDAFNNEDSVQSIKEFENAIKILDELSYYPDIEKNDEYNELSKSLIEDYEKLIASIDEFDPETSIFAFREKINSEAELIDVKKEKIPIPTEIPRTTVPYEINEKVEQFLAYFMDRGHRFLPKWFYRSGIYFPMMRKIFAEEGLPQELIYLSLIESGLNPTARSWANAVGIWQFVKKTGEKYGLTGNFWLEDRRNAEKATRAAALHLKDLYEIYQDWYLVLAAYNCGAGRVNYALRRGKSDNYWEIAKYLPKETRGYVPQYIAISLIFMNPQQYGFSNMELGKPFETANVDIKESIDLSVLAECAEVNEEEMTMMNSELVHGCTPSNYNYSLRIPKDKTSVFIEKLKKVPPEKKRSYNFHIVKKGETASSIAKKYNISKNLLVSINNLDKLPKRRRHRNRSRLPVGIALKIPLKNNSNAIAALSKEPDINLNNESDETGSQQDVKETKTDAASIPSNKIKLIYIAQQNDDLKTIASLYDVRVSDIRNWNDIPYGEEISESDSLEIWISKSKIAQYKNINDLTQTEKSKLISAKLSSNTEKEKKWITHKIKKGETLSEIAEDNNIDIKSLKRWNKIRTNLVKAGQKIKIYTKVPTTLLADNGKNSKTKDITYQVKEGETLYSIAKKSNISLKDLKEWNDIDNNYILKVGQTLRLIQKSSNSKSIAKSENQTKSKKTNPQSYKVKNGDNLLLIANAYNVTVEDIKAWNNLEDNLIKKGQTLKIYSNSPSVSKGDNAKPKTTSKKETYKIKKGDTLYSISKKFSVSIDDLKKWNKIKGQLKSGEKLVIYK